MKSANCPSCGALVQFRAPGSVLAVCEYCRSTLVRQDVAITDIGKMAELVDDNSPIQLLTEGKYRGTHFTVIGRLQLTYDQGYWNEWYILFDDQTTAWLAEAMGEYLVTHKATTTQSIPDFSRFYPGQILKLNGRAFTVTDIEKARCVAGQGELPFVVGAGYELPTVDLRSDQHYATLDFSETPPVFFVGESVTRDDLRLNNLRDTTAQSLTANTQSANLACGACGAAFTLHAPTIERVICQHCGSIIDATDRNFKVIQKNAVVLNTLHPRIPLGSTGTLKGVNYTVIGYMLRTAGTGLDQYQWSEYLLVDQQHRYVWLTEYQGHWSLVRTINSAPLITGFGSGRNVQYQSTKFKIFDDSASSVKTVIGEFYWSVRVGETSRVMDFISPPWILSREKSGKELSWSLGEYLEPDILQQAFALKIPLPARVGVGINQPYGHGGDRLFYWGIAGMVSVMLLIIHMIFVMMGGQIMYQQNLSIENVDPLTHRITTNTFDVTGDTGSLTIANQGYVNNEWIALDMDLVEKDTGKIYPFSREIAFYSGRDSDGYWTEGSPNDTATLTDIDPGKYYLIIEPTLSNPLNRSRISDLQIRRGEVSTFNFFLAELFLLVFPGWVSYQRARFEQRRWEDSSQID